MKKILLLLFVLPVFAFDWTDTPSTVKVDQIESKDIYVIHFPQGDYDRVGTIKLESNKGNIIDQVKLMINQANSEDLDYDAIYTRDGQVGTCIKYKSDAESSAEARFVRSDEKAMYILSKPSAAYDVIGKTEIKLSESINLREFMNQALDLAKAKEADENIVIDGVISENGHSLSFIKYK